MTFLFLFISILFILRNNRYGIFHIIIIFIGLSLIDVILPSILWYIQGIPTRPSWFAPLTNVDLSIGLVYYGIFYFIMFTVMIFISNKKQFNWADKYKLNKKYFRYRLLYLIIFFGAMFIFSLYYEIVAFGGFSEWIVKKFTIRFTGNVSESSGFIEALLTKIPWRGIFNALVFLAFLYRYKVNREKLYGILFPLIGILFALSTSYRGSILQFLLGLLFVEYVRINIHKFYKYKSYFGNGYETIHKPKYYISAIVIVFAFIVYGSIRDSYAADILGYTEKKESTIYKVLNQGSGIDGISSIIHEYGNNVNFIMGKTYMDMMLLPIPRVIYTSKPKWYGIDDITRGMGWPESTQSAVTMPGEAYANFGWLGIFISIIYGLLFGVIIKFINSRGGVYLILYPAIVIPMIFVSNWMAFTGIMNLFFQFLIIVVILKAVITRFTLKGNSI